jgi:hypothetical protein
VERQTKTFLPQHETEARGFVTNIIPYIRHKYPEYQIEHIFLKEAIERNRDSIWNADTNEIVSSADIYLEQSSNVIENFNMIEALGVITTEQKQIPTTEEREKVQQLFLGDDNTSVGTLFTNGGTLMVGSGNICGRIIESGIEDSILQRWTWNKFRGANQSLLVVATVYRPVLSQGPLSTYQHHKSVLLDMDIDECPRSHLLTQLQVQILKWKQEGCQIIVAGDFNEDVSKDNIKTFLEQMQMTELIMNQHGHNGPCTMIKGSKPIDGIFGSKSITTIRSGYQSFDWGMASDHRLI